MVEWGEAFIADSINSELICSSRSDRYCKLCHAPDQKLRLSYLQQTLIAFPVIQEAKMYWVLSAVCGCPPLLPG